jgi:hypothetical protein
MMLVLLINLVFGLLWWATHVVPLPHPVPLIVRIELILISFAAGDRLL